MRNPFGRSLHIGLSSSGIAILQTVKRGATTPLAECLPEKQAPWTPDQITIKLDAILAEQKWVNLPATVVLDDELVRMMMVTPPTNTTRLQDCRAAAEMRFFNLFGESPSDWQIEADWDASRAFLACAIPRSLADALRSLSREYKLTLLTVAPQFIAAWNRWHAALNAAAWFGIMHDERFTLGAIVGRRLCAVRAVPVPAGARQTHWLQDHLAREALRLNLTIPQRLQLCGDIPSHWLDRAMGSLSCERLDPVQHAVLSPAGKLAMCGVRE